MTDPTDIGARVLANLAAGRQRAIERKRAAAQPLHDAVRRQLDIDMLAAHKPRGRAGRIARRIARNGFRVSSRHVQRILDTLSSESDLLRSNASTQFTEADHDR